MAMLWQRFGRAVRNLSLQGKAILLAEPKHFAAEKRAAAERRAKREAQAKKRKAKSHATQARISKKTRTAPPHSSQLHFPNENTDPALVEAVTDSDSEDDTIERVDDEYPGQMLLPPNQDPSVVREGEETLRCAAALLFQDAREMYNSYSTSTIIERTKKAVKAALKELEPVLDHVINADENGFDCRRKPINICFGNDQVGGYFLSSLTPN